MKNIFIASAFLFCFAVEARDLTYKTGVGYRQVYTNAIVYDETPKRSVAQQVNGLEVTYGFARDTSAGIYVGFLPNFDFAMMGPTFRYDVQRLFSRDQTLWQYVNLFTETGFFLKFGNEVKTGLMVQAPSIGVEVLPLTSGFAIRSSIAMTFDFGGKNKFGLTQGMLGDLGVKYYF